MRLTETEATAILYTFQIPIQFIHCHTSHQLFGRILFGVQSNLGSNYYVNVRLLVHIKSIILRQFYSFGAI